MELDIKTVTGGPLDVNTYVVGAAWLQSVRADRSGCGVCGGLRRGLRQAGHGGAVDACAL